MITNRGSAKTSVLMSLTFPKIYADGHFTVIPRACPLFASPRGEAGGNDLPGAVAAGLVHVVGEALVVDPGG